MEKNMTKIVKSNLHTDEICDVVDSQYSKNYKLTPNGNKLVLIKKKGTNKLIWFLIKPVNTIRNNNYNINDILKIDNILTEFDSIEQDNIFIAQESTKKSWINQAMDIFPETRNMTKEELSSYQKSLKKIFKPTGKNFFDL